MPDNPALQDEPANAPAPLELPMGAVLILGLVIGTFALVTHSPGTPMIAEAGDPVGSLQLMETEQRRAVAIEPHLVTAPAPTGGTRERGEVDRQPRLATETAPVEAAAEASAWIDASISAETPTAIIAGAAAGTADAQAGPRDEGAAGAAPSDSARIGEPGGRQPRALSPPLAHDFWSPIADARTGNREIV